MLHLRPFRRNDARRIVTWSLDEESFYKWSAGILGEFPITEEKMIKAVSGRDDNDRYFPFVAFDENGPVGFFILRMLGEKGRTARFGFVILDPCLRGKGYGKQMLQLGLRFAFDLYGAEKATLGVFENNPPARFCYRSVGFRETGVTEVYPIQGREWVCHEMEIPNRNMNGITGCEETEA